jgi:hypothetical protein
MNGSRSPGIVAKADPKRVETAFHHLMIPVHHFLGSDPLLTRLDGDGYAMLIGAADVGHVFSQGSEVAYINIGRNIATRQVTNVQGSIGIGERGGDGISFEFFIFHRGKDRN